MKRFGGDSEHRRQAGEAGRQVGDGDRRAPARAVLSRPGRCAAQHGDQRAPPERDDGAGPHPSHDRDGRAARTRAPRVEQARAEVAAVYARMQSDYKEAYDPGSHYRVAVIPFQEVLGERARLTLWLLMGAAAFVHDHLRRQRRQPDAHARRAPGARAGGARGARRRRRRGCGGCCWSRISCSTLAGRRPRRGHRDRAASGCSPRSPSGTRRAPARSGSTAWCSASRSRCRSRSRCCSRSSRRCRRKARFASLDLRGRCGG